MKTKTNVRVEFPFAGKCNLGAALLLVLLVATFAHAQLTPSDDAYVNSAAPTTNYGAAITLDLSSTADTAFIRFDLTAVPASYTGSSIAKATLKLYVNSATAGSFNVDYVTGIWDEKTIKYSLQPTIGATIAASVPLTATSKGKYVEIDVTSAMVEWLNGTQTNDGIALVANSPLVATFDSKENTSASHPPELDVVFTSGGGITGITTASGSGLMGGGTSGTLNLSLTNACAANQVLQWNGTAWACANLKGNGTITGVTAGTDLAGGGTSGNVTLNLDTTKVPQLSASNSFTGNQNVTGNLGATGSFTGQTASFSASNSTQVVNVTQSGSGSAISASSPGNAGNAAIFGSATTSATGIGIEGLAAGVSGIGVFGGATATTGGLGATGVYGSSSAPNGAGVFGRSVDTINAGVGVGGFSASPNGFGVYGRWQSASSIGAGFSEIGVWGDSSNGEGVIGSSDNRHGVIGISNSGNAIAGYSHSSAGVYGESDNDIGMYGQSGAPSAVGGVEGVHFNNSSTGAGFTTFGVWGDTGRSGGIGVVGTADDGNSLFGKNNTVNYETLYVENDSGFSGGLTPYAARFAGPGASTYCYIPRDSNDNGTGDLVCTGSKSAAVAVDGNRMVRLYAVEAADNWFEDAGSGQLSNGSAAIRFESAFSQTINPSVEYHIFLTPKGDCEGLYVSHEGPDGFEVHELRGGKSNIAFDYRIMARRKGFENVRMQDVTQDFAHMKQESDLLEARLEARKQEEKVHPRMAIPAMPKRAPSPSPNNTQKPVRPVSATPLAGLVK